MVYKCSTCGVSIMAKGNFVKFNCPSCNNQLIVRCKTCKTLSNRYTCSECHFTGP